MPTSSVGNKSKSGAGGFACPFSRRSGVTLLELLIVITIIAVVAGVSYPSVAAGLDGMRLRSTADAIAGFLNTALDRAERRQEVIEVWISARESAMTARSAGLVWQRRLEIPAPSTIARPEEPQRILLYPGGTVPRITIDLMNPSGRHRLVTIDPLTGSARAEGENK
jgi:prepilin-type N-terminal cleavage/methylation domain-containing protein